MRTSLRQVLALVAAAGLAAAAGCAGPQAGAAPETSPAEVHARVLGANPGLMSLRAVVEARLAYAGRRLSLPGVLILDSLGGFRLDLLDPLDRPAAMIYSEGGRVVQYRPGTGVAASLGVFPGDCRAVSPEDWVGAILASSAGLVEGDQVSVRRLFGGDRALERSRGGVLYESVRLKQEGGELVPRTYTWYCDGDPVLKLHVSRWVGAGERRLPGALEVEYLKAGLTVALELREMESNPSLSGSPVRPRLADSTRWTLWRLP